MKEVVLCHDNLIETILATYVIMLSEHKWIEHYKGL